MAEISFNEKVSALIDGVSTLLLLESLDTQKPEWLREMYATAGFMVIDRGLGKDVVEKIAQVLKQAQEKKEKGEN